MPPALRAWLARFLLLLASVAVPLGLGELGSRLAGYRGLEVYRPDAELGWVLRPGQETVTSVGQWPVAISPEGFRDAPLAAPRPDSLVRVAALGASTTYGWGVRLEESYHQLLEARLNAAAQAAGSRVRYEVINAGVIGYNLRQAAGMLDRIARRHAPDGFLVAYTFNDAWNHWGALPAAGRERVLAGVQRKNRLRQSALFNWITGAIARRAYRAAAREAGDHAARVQTGDGAADEAAVAEFRATVDGLVGVSREAGASLVLMVPAARGQVEPWPRQAEMVRAGIDWGIPVADLLPVFRGVNAATAYLADDAVHPSAAGHALIATQVYAALCRAAEAAGQGDRAVIYRAGCGG